MFVVSAGKTTRLLRSLAEVLGSFGPWQQNMASVLAAVLMTPHKTICCATSVEI